MQSLTSLSINTKKIKDNLKSLSLSLSKTSKLMLIVKADAYGLGALPLMKALQGAPIDALSVVHIEEGIRLRQNGETRPILILSQSLVDNIPFLIEHDLSTVVYSINHINALESYAKTQEKTISVHLKLNLGLNRIGCKPEELLPYVQCIQETSFLSLDGIMSHFSHANDPQELEITKKQLREFLDCKKKVETLGLRPSYHIANSAATKMLKSSHLDLVRVGLAAYENSLSFESHIIHCHIVPKGATISYMGKYRSSKQSCIAVVAAGYADGLPSTLSNRGQVLIKGQLFPIVGQICMDMIMVDLGDNPLQCQSGDVVTFFGENHGKTITLDHFSRDCGKNPREVLCGIGSRVTRHYL